MITWSWQTRRQSNVGQRGQPAAPRWNIAPYFIVDDVVTTANYYRDKLGFQYVESDRPSPVQSITCAARQAGHLGANTRMALGRTHAKMSAGGLRTLLIPED